MLRKTIDSAVSFYRRHKVVRELVNHQFPKTSVFLEVRGIRLRIGLRTFVPLPWHVTDLADVLVERNPRTGSWVCTKHPDQVVPFVVEPGLHARSCFCSQIDRTLRPCIVCQDNAKLIGRDFSAIQ